MIHIEQAAKSKVNRANWLKTQVRVFVVVLSLNSIGNQIKTQAGFLDCITET